MLHIHLGNRSDALATALATLMRVDPLPLLEPETVVVSSTALARWLDFRLADELGIATQNACVFPAAHVWQMFGRVLPDVAVSNPFDRTILHWRLLRLLGTCRAHEVRHYLTEDDGTRQFELASRLAALFDRYLVERPDWLAAWTEGARVGLGPDEAWQGGLWRALVAELTDVGSVHPRERFLASLQAQPALRVRLPRRISLFCVEAMPDLYWDVFVGLAQWIDLHVFVLSPCREYWGDIEALRKRLRMEIEQPDAAVLYETGHPLLASLGKARQHATVRLADATAQVASVEHAYFSMPPETLLGRLQRDILELSPGAGVQADASLQVHACHGALREAEVLLDRLLEQFERLPDLQPSDILILTPDIETYGPIVAAVLGHASRPHRIPCAVADRPLAVAPLWRALRQLCVVAAGELDAESVLSLLDEPAVRRASGIGENDLSHLRDWVGEAGIRWGIDGDARARRGLPADDAYSWRAGLQRLLLGVALPDTSDRLWRDQLPVGGIEGERAALLGRFVDYVEALFELAAKVSLRETAPAWQHLLRATLDHFLAPDETEEAQVQRLRASIDRIGEQATRAGCVDRLPLTVLLRELDAQLAEQASAQAFVSGAATIAALQPGRPLAARVVCLVGMNDGAWPQPETLLGFDLIRQYPRPGDRNRRGEERYALLEAILCAKNALIVTYTGRDPRSNVELPPAAPLAELIDTLSAMTGREREWIVEHPLQPFGTAYFAHRDARLFSFDAEHCALTAQQVAVPFVSPATRVAGAGSGDIALEDLQRYFAHPARYFLREVLGIHLEESEELLEIHEPFILDRLAEYHLRAAQFEGLRAGQEFAATARLLRARGWLPQGVVGELAARTARDEALPLWQAAQDWLAAERVEPVIARFESAGAWLSARIDGVTKQGLWRVRHGSVRPVDRLRLWIDHLVLNITAPAGIPLRSVLIAQDGELAFEPEPCAPAILAELLAIYRQGQQQALAFYPKTAWAWLEQKNVRREWEGDEHTGKPGERDDPYIRLVLRDRAADPLDADFQQLARRIYGSLRMALKDDDD